MSDTRRNYSDRDFDRRMSSGHYRNIPRPIMHESLSSDMLADDEPIVEPFIPDDDVIDMSGSSHDNDGNEYPDEDR